MLTKLSRSQTHNRSYYYLADKYGGGLGLVNSGRVTLKSNPAMCSTMITR